MKRIGFKLMAQVFALTVLGCAPSESESKPCHVVQSPQGATIECPDGSSAFLSNGTNGTNGTNGEPGQDGADGSNGANGTDGASAEPCSVTRESDGAQIDCPDGSSAFVSDGSDGAGASCTVVPAVAGATVSCSDGSSAFVADGSDVNARCGILEVVAPSSVSLSVNEPEQLLVLQGCTRIQASIVISGSNTIESLAGLEDLVVVGDSFVIDTVPNLENIDALANLEVVGGAFFINRTSVRTIAPLASLQRVRDGEPELSFQSNPLLPQCEINALAARIGATCFNCTGNNGLATCP